MGRPTKFDDPEVRRKLIEATRIGATRTIAARYAGVPESVLYAWLKRGKQGEDRYQEFREEILKASSSHAVEHLALISAHARSDKPNSWQASAWMLERRHQGYSKDPVKPDELSHEANELSIEQIKAEITHADKLLANMSAPSLIDVDDDDG